MKLKDVCTNDIVVDTNVLSHAHNPSAPSHESALGVVQWIASSGVLWILDDQGKGAPDPSTSVLFSEYNSTLPPQSFALVLLTAFLAGGRVKFAPRPGHADRKAIQKLVSRNTNDQAILGATIGCSNRVLISNDEDDFSEKVRASAKRAWGAAILLSDELDVA